MAKAITRPFRRSLAWMLLIVLALGGALGAAATWSNSQLTPLLGLDLEGGTQMVLQPQVEAGEVNTEQLAQAVDIIRARVDGQGVAEAEVATLGNNVVVAVPGQMTRAQEEALRQSSQMRFRPVLFAIPATAQPEPTATPTGGTASPTAATGGATARAGTASPTASPASPTSPATAGAVLPPGLQKATPSATPTPASPTASPAATPAATPTASPAATPTQSPGIGLPSANPTGQEGEPSITPEQAQDPQALIEYATNEAWLTPTWEQRLTELECDAQPSDATRENLLQPTVACSSDRQVKYLLGPSVIEGSDLADASSGPTVSEQTGQPTGGYQVNLQMQGGQATTTYATVSRFMVSLPEPRNQLAVVLDNSVVSAPRFQSAIPDGRAQITGDFTAETAQQLANQLKFGALPMSFTVQSTEQVSPTIGGDQLRLGIIAGLIGLLLVMVYSFLQYRALAIVTVASLLMVALLTYLCLTLLGWGYNLRLTMAGVTGAIVAIGTTADSFIVYFERVRDEVREGRRLQSAVQTGWKRARRTILVSDAVSFLAAVVLYVLATSNVRGFAFMLILTTLLDIIVTFLFTHPMLSLLSHTKFFGGGHKWSGFHPETLGVRPVYRGRGRMTIADRKQGATPEGSPA